MVLITCGNTTVTLLRQLSFPFIELACHQHKLDPETPSAVQFTIHPDSLHKIHNIRLDRQKIEYIVPITGPAVHIDQLDASSSYSLIYDKLLSLLPIRHKDRDRLTYKIIFESNALMNRTETNGNQLWLINLKMEVRTVVVFKERERANYERLIRGSDVRSNYGMVPATWSSISGLEQDIINNEDEDSCESSSCAICLGDLRMGSYATRMPCQHVFHVKCIVKWLNSSHYCPMCRFEMPT